MCALFHGHRSTRQQSSWESKCPATSHLLTSVSQNKSPTPKSRGWAVYSTHHETMAKVWLCNPAMGPGIHPRTVGEDKNDSGDGKRCYTSGCGHSTSTCSLPESQICPRASASLANSGFKNTQVRCVVIRHPEPPVSVITQEGLSSRLFVCLFFQTLYQPTILGFSCGDHPTVLHSSGSLCVAVQSLGMKPMGSAKLSSSKRPDPDPLSELLDAAVPEARPSQ